jgi:hypothetical protein
MRAGQDLNERRFACAILADQAMAGASLDFEAHIVQRLNASEVLGEISDLENVVVQGAYLARESVLSAHPVGKAAAREENRGLPNLSVPTGYFFLASSAARSMLPKYWVLNQSCICCIVSL